MITNSVMKTDPNSCASSTSLTARTTVVAPWSSIAASTSGAVRFSPSRLALPAPW